MDLPREAVNWKPAAVPSPMLTAEQSAAWHEVEHALGSDVSRTFLLFGVTGSGKTEIYLRAVAWCLRRAKTAIILVPEIALASQVVRRFEARFPGEVAVLHSALSDRDRYLTWRSIESGDRRIVIGPRSALFAPVRNLGLIVLDEEHDAAYKQESDPRYHARAVAEQMAGSSAAVVLLGSATPSIETYRRASNREIALLELRSRVGYLRLRYIIRRRASERRNRRYETGASPGARDHHRGASSHVDRANARGKEQAMLLLNRRGMSTIVMCRACGHTLVCPLCEILSFTTTTAASCSADRCNFREAPRRTVQSALAPSIFSAPARSESKRRSIGSFRVREYCAGIKTLCAVIAGISTSWSGSSAAKSTSSWAHR